MKHINANGRGTPFSIPILKSNYIFINNRKSGLVTLLICLFSFHFVCFAQESRESGATGKGEIKPLQIGDTIPEELWHLPLKVLRHPEGKETISLNDYRDKKLIILDFWGTFCSSCIAAMPNNEAVMKQFSDDIVVLPVTIQDEQKIAPVISTNKLLEKLDLTFVIEDEIFSQVFPYRIVPHYVWIDKEGKVIHLTSSQSLTAANIDKILKNQEGDIIFKSDQNVEDPIYFKKEEFPNSVSLEEYSVLIKGQVAGLPCSQTLRKNEKGENTGLLTSNFPLSSIFSMIVRNLIPDFNMKKMIFEKAELNSILEQRLSLDYFQKDLYSFDYNKYPIYYEDMLDELALALGMSARIETRLMDCLVLTVDEKQIGAYISDPSNKEPYQFIDDKVYLQNSKLGMLLTRLNSTKLQLPLVVNESGYNERLSFELESDLEDVEGIKQELQNHGVYLTPAKREIEVLVLSSRKTGTTLR